MKTLDEVIAALTEFLEALLEVAPPEYRDEIQAAIRNLDKPHRARLTVINGGRSEEAHGNAP